MSPDVHATIPVGTETPSPLLVRLYARPSEAQSVSVKQSTRYPSTVRRRGPAPAVRGVRSVVDPTRRSARERTAMAMWTPGPWHYDPRTRTAAGPDGTRVALILTEVNLEIVEANSRLIVEAPALFEVLGEAQELGAFLLAERRWSLQTEELVRINVERVNAVMATVTGPPRRETAM